MSTIPFNKFLTAFVFGFGIFHLIAPKELQDKYSFDSLLGFQQKQSVRHIAGGALILLGIYLNTLPNYKLIQTPAIISRPESGTGKANQFVENYANFPDYETFVI